MISKRKQKDLRKKMTTLKKDLNRPFSFESIKM